MEHNYWNYVPVSSIAKIYLGGTPSRSVSEYWNGDIKWASAKDIAESDARYIFDAEETITRKGLQKSAAKLMDRDTIVITARGTVGAIRMLGTPMSFNQTCYGLVAKVSIVPNFLYYGLKAGIEDIKSLSYGTIFDTITKKTFDSLLIHLPPLPEQRAIAEILGTLDDKIEVNRRMNATLESMARAVFRQWFVENEEVGKWEVGKTKDLCLRVENGGTPRRDKPEFWEPGTIPWLTSGEVRQNIITLTENKISESGYQNSSAKLWPSDTTVVALYGATAGEVSFIAQELCANQACCGLIPKPDTKYFLYLTLSSSAENLSLQARGSAQQNLSQQIVADFPVIIPDNKSLENFNNIVESMFEKWILNLKESRALASLRDGLLPKLMRGEVRVRNVQASKKGRKDD